MSARVVALLLAAACPGLARSQAQAQLASASRVCVKNTAGFDLSFDLWDTATNSLSSRSPSFSSSEQQCLDMSALGGVEPGQPVVAVVHADTGESHSLPPLLYSPASGGEAAATANFSCAGGADDFSCSLNGKKVDDQPGALEGVPASEQDRARRICVQNSADFRMKVRLWDTATGTFGNWSQGFDMWAGGSASDACVDGASLAGVASGHPLVLVVSPEGASPSLVRSILYDPDATTPVLVECWGGAEQYSCEYKGAWRRLQAAAAAAAAPVLV